MINIVLDLVMGFICILCVVSIIGLLMIDVVLEYWLEMRKI